MLRKLRDNDYFSLSLTPKTVTYILGSVVLPILGAVPDGCIVLFSGMGPNAAEELAVGNATFLPIKNFLNISKIFLSIQFDEFQPNECLFDEC